MTAAIRVREDVLTLGAELGVRGGVQSQLIFALLGIQDKDFPALFTEAN